MGRGASSGPVAESPFVGRWTTRRDDTVHIVVRGTDYTLNATLASGFFVLWTVF